MANGKAIIARPEIDDYISLHYPTTRAKVIARHLGLKEKYIQNRASFLGVNKNSVQKKTIDRQQSNIVVSGNRTIHRMI